MAISHVIRGEDHLSNTPKHILLFEAMGSPIPAVAHLPLILNPDRTKMEQAQEPDRRGGLSRSGVHSGGIRQLPGAPRLVDRYSGGGAFDGRA